ncbi:GFA family protein [Marinobacterium maritimum]|uniref:GFA family protein n=1 Tax=Marinobacterium maritimum TaxID=500162 RepID=A0ABN1I2X7_9GAMM
MDRKHRGACLCNRVQFEVEGNFDSFFLCYCEHCRKDTGSAHAANLFSRSATLNWLKGRESVRTYRLDKTQHSKSFCLNCGSALPTHDEHLNLLVVPSGSLDTAVDIKPDARIFLGSKAEWVDKLDCIPGFDTLPQLER